MISSAYVLRVRQYPMFVVHSVAQNALPISQVSNTNDVCFSSQIELKADSNVYLTMKKGRIYPHPPTKGTDWAWRCADCGFCPDATFLKQALEQESDYKENFPLSLSGVISGLKNSLLHPLHYLVFWAVHGTTITLGLVFHLT